LIVSNARNVNSALAKGIALIEEHGVTESSRNGPVRRIQQPVSTVYKKPAECVLFAPWRDANPFFHVIEAMWMIAGREDLAPLIQYVSTFGQFSDDGGKTMPAAYGKRWHGWDGGYDHEYEGSWGDQLDWVVSRLSRDVTDRRTVINMWDPAVDPRRADNGGKDIPCNLNALPYVTNGALNITVSCRSNDMVLGAYGANAVHFSFLLQYLAGRLGLDVGEYTQHSNNFHVYDSSIVSNEWSVDPYEAGEVTPMPLFYQWDNTVIPDEAREVFIRHDLAVFFDEGAYAAAQMCRWPFLSKIVIPMALAHKHWKGKKGVPKTEDNFEGALDILGQMPAGNDWRRAAEEWISRRYVKWLSIA